MTYMPEHENENELQEYSDDSTADFSFALISELIASSVDDILVIGPVVYRDGDASYLNAMLDINNGLGICYIPFDDVADADEWRDDTLRTWKAQPHRTRVYVCSTELAFAATCYRIWPCDETREQLERIRSAPGGDPGEVTLVENASLVWQRYADDAAERAAYEAAAWTVARGWTEESPRAFAIMRWIGFGEPPEPTLKPQAA